MRPLIITSSPRRCALPLHRSPASHHRHRLAPLQAQILPGISDVDTLVAVAGGQLNTFIAATTTQLQDPQLISKISSQPDVIKWYNLALEQPLVTLGVAGASLFVIPRVLSLFVRILLTPIILALAAWAVVQHPGESWSLAHTCFNLFSANPVLVSVLITVLAVIGLLPSLAMTSLALGATLLLLGLDVDQGRLVDPLVLKSGGSSLESMQGQQVDVKQKLRQ
ncbi:MAG: hypothetical protein WDW38_002556 [Sanguina aurantia]